MAGSTFTIDGANGAMKNTAWMSGANKLLQVDASGNVLPLAPGTNTQILFGDGTWGNLPASATAFSAIGNALSIAPGMSLGIGTTSPQYPLDVSGDARISNNLYVGGGIVITDNLHAATSVTTSALTASTISTGATSINGDLTVSPTGTVSTGVINSTGDISTTSKLSVAGNATFNQNVLIGNNIAITGNIQATSLANGTGFAEVFANASGNLFAAPVNPNSCSPGSPAWRIGGNSLLNAGLSEISVGTCDNFNFILKSNNVKSQWVQPDGTISFGNLLQSNTGGPEFRFDAGIIRMSNTNSFGGAGLIFDGGVHPYGDWGIEYNNYGQFAKSGINFWKPYASPNSSQALFFLADDGTIGIGTPNTTTSRLTVDAWAGDGLQIRSNPTTTAIEVYNKSTGKAEFQVRSQGLVYAREIIVTAVTPFPDYVFAKEYKLPSLYETKKFVTENHHLRNMPTAEEVNDKGAGLGEIQKATVEKLEEAYLYIFQLKEEINSLSEKIKNLEKK